jgi:hypothetical protein
MGTLPGFRLLTLLLLACEPIELGKSDTTPAADVVGTYQLGWPIDACRDDIPAEGEGHAIGEVLPQFHFQAQTGETVALHDFCNRVIYIELGYFT